MAPRAAAAGDERQHRETEDEKDHTGHRHSRGGVAGESSRRGVKERQKRRPQGQRCGAFVHGQTICKDPTRDDADPMHQAKQVNVRECFSAAWTVKQTISLLYLPSKMGNFLNSLAEGVFGSLWKRSTLLAALIPT